MTDDETKPKMRGGVVKRGATWSYKVSVRDPATGERRQRWVGGFATQREAKAARSAALTRHAEGTHVEPSKILLREWLDGWLTAQEAIRKPGTVAAYRAKADRYIVPRLGGTPLRALSAPQLDAFYAQLIRSGGQGGKPLAPATVAVVHAVVSKSLGDAVRKGMLTVNPATNATVPTRPAHPEDVDQGDGLPPSWTAAQLRAFIGHVSEDRLRALWALALSTGMRRGELLGLRWVDVDLDARRLHVRQQITTVRGKPTFGTPKTGKTRSFTLDRETVAELRSHRQRQLQERLAWGPAWRDTGLVFTREDGTLINPQSVTDVFARHIKAAGLPRIRLHDTRHTFATLALQAGVNVKVVSERLGHASVQITWDTYSHVLPDQDEQAADLFAAFVWGAREGGG